MIGFPEWWDDNRIGGRGRSRGASNSRGGKRGCGSGGGRGSASTSSLHRANVVQGGVKNNGGGGISAQGHPTHGVAGVTSDLAQQIIDLLTKPKQRLEGTASVCIVDTGDLIM